MKKMMLIACGALLGVLFLGMATVAGIYVHADLYGAEGSTNVTVWRGL